MSNVKILSPLDLKVTPVSNIKKGISAHEGREWLDAKRPDEYSNRLEEFFFLNDNKITHKARHYFDIYHRHFKKFCNTEAHIVELGVAQGGSLEMWKYYFGSKSKIYGIDFNPYCKQLEDEQTQILIGNIDDEEFRRDIVKKIPQIDIFIDDGSHHVDQQINTLKSILPYIRKGGVYLCEDISYRETYGGGYLKKGTFLEYAKRFVDYVQGLYPLYGPIIYKDLYSVCVYNCIVVIEKLVSGDRRPMTSGLKELDHSYEVSEEEITKWKKDRRQHE